MSASTNQTGSTKRPNQVRVSPEERKMAVDQTVNNLACDFRSEMLQKLGSACCMKSPGQKQIMFHPLLQERQLPEQWAHMSIADQVGAGIAKASILVETGLNHQVRTG